MNKLITYLAFIALLCLSGNTYAQSQSGKQKFKGATQSASQFKGKINLNKASLEQLQSLPGIGKKKAQAILDYRKKHGKFKSTNDLTKVKGIGEKMLKKLKGKISV